MAKNRHFSFKQFTVYQELCAMKVCTDACLFGAWVDVEGARQVLDIGTGTGLLALMVAQRNGYATIETVEIDKEACDQARQNFQASPFANRLDVYHLPIQAFFPEKQYDCIICNPPFFQNDLPSPDKKITTAHHAKHLDFKGLTSAVGRLLAPGGAFHLLLPVAESERYQTDYILDNWVIERELLLSHQPGKLPFRRMTTYRATSAERSHATAPQYEQLYIYDEKGLIYDPAFKDYLKAFYLGF